MSGFLHTLVSFIAALAILISVHEFGHYWVARRLGVKVLRFSLGFGPPLWRRVDQRDGTEFVIAAIPLGGYVKMLDEREGKVAPEELPRAFNRQSLLTRTAIVIAGPLFNLLFAVVAYWGLLVVGESGTRAVIGTVAEDSIGAKAGFRPGDQILAIGDRTTPTWESVLLALMTGMLEEGDLPVEVSDFGGAKQTRWLPAHDLAQLPEDPAMITRIGLSPAAPTLPAVIGELVPGEAAAMAGLREGDRILGVEGEPIETWDEWVGWVRTHPERELVVEIERDGVQSQLRVTPRTITQGNQQVGRIGAGVAIPSDHGEEHRILVRLGPVAALGEAVRKTYDMAQLMLKILGRMAVGRASVEHLSGPISIAESAGKSASDGPSHFVKFLAVVSISLGIINLLPIPVLDGGHLLYFFIEAVKGTPLSEQFQLQGQRIGLTLLLMLMGLALYVDLGRLLG